MKNKSFLITLLLLLAGGLFLYFTFAEETEDELAEEEVEEFAEEVEEVITDEKLLEIISLDAKGLAFLEGYDNFQISTKKLLSKEKIEERKEEGDFKEIFEPLLVEDERYLKVRLDDWAGGRGIIGTIDLEKGETVIIHNLFLARI